MLKNQSNRSLKNLLGRSVTFANIDWSSFKSITYSHISCVLIHNKFSRVLKKKDLIQLEVSVWCMRLSESLDFFEEENCF